jgi:hypothetical protein
MKDAAMTLRKSRWLFVLALLPSLALAQDRAWGSLAVYQDLQPGIWRSSVVAIPRAPGTVTKTMPKRSAGESRLPPLPRTPVVETRCVPAAEILGLSGRMMSMFDQPNPNCQVVIVRDNRSLAVVEERCQAIAIVIPGITTATIPAVTTRTEISRLNNGQLKISVRDDQNSDVWEASWQRITSCAQSGGR